MDSFDLGSLNYWAILVAVVFNQALGAAWYSGLAKPWMAEVGLTADDMEAMKGTPPAVVPLRAGRGSSDRVHARPGAAGPGTGR